MKKITWLSLLMACLLLGSAHFAAAQVKSEPYEWKNVQIVGGGFVDGIVFHPIEKNLRYCRTDMGGAYRWNESQKRWIPLLDWISYEDNNLVGVESIALDKNDPDALYLSCGTYTNDRTPNGAILRSFDRGKTFDRVDVPFKMGGNENGRGNGERMAVDPANGKIIYLGTRKAGLWKSSNKGKTWSQVTSFPDITEEMPKPEAGQDPMPRWNRGPQGCGIVFVLFDQSKSTKKGCSDIYVGVSLMNRDNIFRSTDGGKTWSALAGQPTAYRPNHAVIASDGVIYITYGTNPGPMQMTNGAVWKFDTKSEKWSDITPDKPDDKARFGYASVSVDAKNPKVLIASSFYRPGERGGEEIFRSLNGGESWIEVMKTGKIYDFSLAPYVQHTGIHWLFDIEIDPFNSDHAMFTTGFGGFETFDLSKSDKGEAPTWSVMSTGIEETVPLELCAPPAGAHLITGIGDYGGFVHWDLDKPAPEGNYLNPHFGNTDGVTVAWQKPEIVVRVGVESGSRGRRNIAYSEDFGKTWQPTTTMPDDKSAHGHIAVSSDGKTWVWTPQRSVPYVTVDKGNTWTAIDLPRDIRIVADKENPNKFYGIDIYSGKLFTSTDAAKTFVTTDLNLEKGIPDRQMSRADGRGGQDRIYATPGFENDRWIAAFDGLYHSATQAEAFKLMGHVSEIHAFGLGKEAPGCDYPALYLIGVVDGQRGIFRSTDKAQSWVRINDDQHQWGLVLHVSGDPKVYGRVYVGTHGRGAIYGDPK